MLVSCTLSNLALLVVFPRIRFSRAVLWDLFYMHATSGLHMGGNNKSGTYDQSPGKRHEAHGAVVL